MDETTIAESRLTCSLEEAAEITGLSYDYLLGQSKIANPQERLPGWRPNRSAYRVVVARIPGWLDKMAGLS